MTDTITLDALWAVFTRIKGVVYGTSVEVRSNFRATPEMIYNCFQKELNAQAKISMN